MENNIKIGDFVGHRTNSYAYGIVLCFEKNKQKAYVIWLDDTGDKYQAKTFEHCNDLEIISLK